MILALGLLLFAFAALPVRGRSSSDAWIGGALVALLALGVLVFVYAVPEPSSRDAQRNSAHVGMR